ncbi:cupredoxin domain-containing protein [Candidatus Microgenomates bacterium]|nr:cupredoxin domain-containing protein [Candidatus Microgenomates bacterium]
MNKNYIVVGAIVLLLLLGGAAFAFKHKIKTALMGDSQPVEQAVTPAPVSTPTPATSEGVMEKEAIVEVDYTATGFSPATVTIKKGQTVKFVNKSGSSMSVASNPHPTHTDYPGFDQFKSTSKGQTEYDFAFDKVGTWGYHNHLNPSDGGTVIVLE